jgi:hypothetical protein
VCYALALLGYTLALFDQQIDEFIESLIVSIEGALPQ